MRYMYYASTFPAIFVLRADGCCAACGRPPSPRSCPRGGWCSVAVRRRALMAAVAGPSPLAALGEYALAFATTGIRLRQSMHRT